MIEDLKKNVETQINMLREISADYEHLDRARTPDERRVILNAIRSLGNGIKIINNSIPGLVEQSKAVKRLPQGRKPEIKKNLEVVNFKGLSGEFSATISSKDKAELLKELSINESLVKKMKRKSKKKVEEKVEFKRAKGYVKLSNKVFLGKSKELIGSGKFRGLSIAIQKANLNMLLESYVSVLLFSTLLSGILGVFLWIFLGFFEVNLAWPLVEAFRGDNLLRFLQMIWLPFALPAGVFGAIYYYPRAEARSIAIRIDQELPFAVIHMSAISGSGIEPSKIFSIIGTNKEYKYLGKEMIKILNQINLYGYDLVSALNNTSKITPSAKLSELLSGLSTGISSGSSLSDFFEKRANSLLLSYRLEREKFTKMAETFMDVYISIVIAAPMVLLLLLVLISISGINIGFGTGQLSVMMIGVIGLLNLLFIWILNIKQPSY